MSKLLLAALAMSSLALGAMPLYAHGHAHPETGASAQVQDEAARKAEFAKGHFADGDVALRPLSDWAGKWQSVYPLLADGTLDPVMAQKAKKGDKSAADYRAYYETGYRSDVTGIEISAEGSFAFVKEDGSRAEGRYAADGYEILTYEKGNRGVRFIFRKTAGDAGAPAFVQFSDHRIAPETSDHFHLYWGDDRAALLSEVTNWPTYYPANLSAAEILAEMLAH